MRLRETKLSGVMLIEPDVYGDERGYFMELWNAHRYAEVGLPENLVQDNVSTSRRGVLRGLHFQNPSPQGKLVSVLQGEVFDVAVDLRLESPTFSQWVGVYLSDENKRQLYVPDGFAHGFLVLSEWAVFHYKCTEYYRPADEHSIRWDDPQIDIEWPIETPVLSRKDRSAPLLAELEHAHLFD